jgi:C_GCAxxG_C_C family probable redox protein
MANLYSAEIEAKAKTKALKNFTAGLNCCQSVLAALAEYTFEIDNNELAYLKKLATGFGGGIGGQGRECGVLTAIVMAFGDKTGTTTSTEPRKPTSDIVKQSYEMFQSEYGHALCKDLCPCDLSTEEDRKEAHENVCRKYVSSGIRIFFNLMRSYSNPQG